MLRRSVTLGMLASAISTGVVMNCSTSCAPNRRGLRDDLHLIVGYIRRGVKRQL